MNEVRSKGNNLDPCIFCGDYRTIEASNAGMSNPILIDFGDFFISPDFTPLNKGHLLIIPKKHILSLSDLNAHEYSKLLKIIKLMNVVEDSSDLLLFEHGSVVPRYSGTSIDHAHLHVLIRPEGFDWTYVDKYVSGHNLGNPFSQKGFPKYRILRELEIARQPYILVVMDNYYRLYTVKAQLESQFLRKAFKPWTSKWNWKNDFLSETGKTLYEESHAFLIQNITKGGLSASVDIASFD